MDSFIRASFSRSIGRQGIDSCAALRCRQACRSPSSSGQSAAISRPHLTSFPGGSPAGSVAEERGGACAASGTSGCATTGGGELPGTALPEGRAVEGGRTGLGGEEIGWLSGTTSLWGRRRMTSPQTPPRTRQLSNVTKMTAPMRDEPAKEPLGDRCSVPMDQRNA